MDWEAGWMSSSRSAKEPLRVAELFAGVGGFRLGLEGISARRSPDGKARKGAGYEVVWSNQWEPATKSQHASACYAHWFGEEGHSNEDIAVVVDELKSKRRSLPEFDVLVGGFPCQDYSVAKVLSQAAGISGKKGVLWWEIFRLLEEGRPKHLILENVDRLLKSPATQRGRDFAVMLWCLQSLGYAVEWRVVNAADYGFPQRRRRVFIVGHRMDVVDIGDRSEWLLRDGVLARAFRITAPGSLTPSLRLDSYIETPRNNLQDELAEISVNFGVGDKRSSFLTAGVMWKGEVWTTHAEPVRRQSKTLGEILIPDSDVPKEFFIPKEQLERWDYLKGSKKELRNGTDGFTYYYNEGPVAFPEPLDQPSRTILTGEGGSSPSRFKHVVKQSRRGYRRLTPIELERLNGFPDGWTDTGMSDVKRAFMMGNALVVGLVNRIGQRLSRL
jgi:DNA (cytosine-5)-methyltransferase 1